MRAGSLSGEESACASQALPGIQNPAPVCPAQTSIRATIVQGKTTKGVVSALLDCSGREAPSPVFLQTPSGVDAISMKKEIRMKRMTLASATLDTIGAPTSATANTTARRFSTPTYPPSLLTRIRVPVSKVLSGTLSQDNAKPSVRASPSPFPLLMPEPATARNTSSGATRI